MRAGSSATLPAGVAAGAAEQVLDALAPLAAAFSGERDHRLCVRLHYPGMARAEVEDHIGRFASEILPRLRAAATSNQGA